MVFHMATSRIIISTLELITVTIVLKRIMRCVYARKVVVGFEGGSRITGGCLDAEFQGCLLSSWNTASITWWLWWSSSSFLLLNEKSYKRPYMDLPLVNNLFVCFFLTNNIFPVEILYLQNLDILLGCVPGVLFQYSSQSSS